MRRSIGLVLLLAMLAGCTDPSGGGGGGGGASPAPAASQPAVDAPY